MSTHAADARPTAWIVLPGHPNAPARLTVTRYSSLARFYRTVWYAFLWIGGSTAMFFVTIFDPFMTSLPFFVGAVMTFRSWRGRFKVLEFRGACPRCLEPLKLKPPRARPVPGRVIPEFRMWSGEGKNEGAEG
jgi:hypothetical protein